MLNTPTVDISLIYIFFFNCKCSSVLNDKSQIIYGCSVSKDQRRAEIIHELRATP